MHKTHARSAPALTFGFALPTMAAVNWDEFRITKQPQNLTIKSGESFTLNVVVNVPKGAEEEYQWYYYYPGNSVRIEGATASELHLDSDDNYYPEYNRLGGYTDLYFCVVTAYEKDDGGTIIPSQKLKSDNALVTTGRTILGKLLDVTIAPFGYASTATVVSPVFIFIFPLAYLGFLIYFYGKGFIGLFS